MIGFTLLVMLVVSQLQQQGSSDALQDRSFNITGFFCHGAGCEATPRHLGASLRFQATTHGPGFDGAVHLKENWSVRLDCAVSRDRLKACRFVDAPDGRSTGRAVALKLVDEVRLSPAGAREPRAIVDVEYEVGGCPQWFCTATPPPPPKATI